MRRTTVGLLAAIAATMFTFQLSAADGPAPKEGPPRAPMMFPRLDKNHDGKITADEVPDGAPDFVKEMLKRADKDGDKTVTAEEFRGSLQAFRGGPPGPAAGFPGRRPDGPAGPQGRGPSRPATSRGQRPSVTERPAGMTPPRRPGFSGPGAASPASRPDPKALFARLDKDGDQKLSLDEFAEGMKRFHSPAMASRGPRMGRPPMLGRGPMGPHPRMGRPPMAGRPPMMGRGLVGPHPGMGRGPMMGARGAWAKSSWANSPWARSPWARQAWAGAPHRWPAVGGPAAAWAKPRGPVPGHAAAMLGRLQAADKDKDGKLSKSEAPERLRQHFDKVDANKDGQLDKGEMGKALHAFGQQTREAMAKHRAETAKKMHEARAKAVEKQRAVKQDVEKRHAERKHTAAKKPIEKKVEEKKAAEKKAAEKKAEGKKPADKKPAEKKS